MRGTANVTIGRTTPEPVRHPAHPASWWAQFQEVSGKFDAGVATEGLADLIIPKITSPLLRREAAIAAEIVVLHLNKINSTELDARAAEALRRLTLTVERLNDRAAADSAGLQAAQALCHALGGRWAEAAAAVEPFVGTQPLLKVFVSALLLEQFDQSLTVRLLRAGHEPASAVRSGLAVGRYAWWPSWLIKIVADRAMAGTLGEDTIAALERCAYAELTPAQAGMARRLLNGDEALVEASARRLEGLGEQAAAAMLRAGDLSAVALATRLIPL